jgi:hypothetical protein
MGKSERIIDGHGFYLYIKKSKPILLVGISGFMRSG